MRSLVGSLIALGLVACQDASPNVILETDLGNIEIEVYPKQAPISAADFLYYVDEGLYDSQGFYRTVRADNDPREMGMSLIQGGRLELAPVTSPIEHETTDATGLSNISGSVAIARDAPGTGSAAFFFINIGDNTFLDYGGERNPDGQGYAVFGKVVLGMDTVRAIQAQEAKGDSQQQVTQGQFLTEPVIITKAYRK